MVLDLFIMIYITRSIGYIRIAASDGYGAMLVLVIFFTLYISSLTLVFRTRILRTSYMQIMNLLPPFNRERKSLPFPFHLIYYDLEHPLNILLRTKLDPFILKFIELRRRNIAPGSRAPGML